MNNTGRKLLSDFARRLDRSRAPDDIKKFVIKKYAGIVHHGKLTEETEVAVAKIQDNLAMLGWMDSYDADLAQKHSQRTELGQASFDWADRMANCKVVSHGIVTVGCGLYLDYLDEHDSQKKDFMIDSMESLLKVVEVKRKKILVSFPKDISAQEMLIEAVRLSILFSRYACRHSDLRFLNASLKLNDWIYSKFRKSDNGNPLILFLLALTEQEKCAAELCK